MPRLPKPEHFPERIEPQLVTTAQKPPPGLWRYEIKYDGYRMLACIGQQVRLFTRNGFDWTTRMPRLVSDLQRIDVYAWLDGEVVIQDATGRPAFDQVQQAFQTGCTDDLVYCVFDIMYLGEHDLRAAPLDTRRAVLAEFLAQYEFDRVRMSDTIDAEPDLLLKHACQLRLEGIIGKKASSRYCPGRSGAWIKLKCDNRQEFVIVGYTGGAGGISSLVIALYAGDGEVTYAGRVRSGIDDRAVKYLRPKLKALESRQSSLAHVPPSLAKHDVTWVEPVLVCEVKFTEITSAGKIRHGVFVAMREDRLARTVTGDGTMSPTIEVRQD